MNASDINCRKNEGIGCVECATPCFRLVVGGPDRDHPVYFPPALYREALAVLAKADCNRLYIEDRITGNEVLVVF